MKIHISLLNIIRAEVYKASRSKLIIGTLLSPLVVYLLMSIYIIYKGRDGLFDYTALAYSGDPWLMVWSRYTLPLFSLMFPLILIVLSYLICEFEFQNNNIRSLFSFPIVWWKLYLSKFIVLSVLIIALCIITWSGFVLFGYLLGEVIPAYRFAEYAIGLSSSLVMLRALLASFCVGVFGLVVSLLTRNFTIPILLGVFLTASAIFVTNESVGEFIPFTTFTYLASVRPIDELTSFTTRDVINIGFLCIAMPIGYISFTPEKRFFR